MNSLKQYVLCLCASIFCIVFVSVFYCLYVFLGVGKRNEIIGEKMQLWNKSEPESYSYIVHEGCMLSRSYQVIHSNNEDLYIDIKKYCDPKDGPKCDSKKNNIADIFNRVREMSETVEVLDVVYSPLGYPEKVTVNKQRDIDDDECFIVIKDFKKI